MNLRLGLFLAFFLVSGICCGKDALKQFLKKADSFLGHNVKDGRVNYFRIQQNPASLNQLITLIGKLPLDKYNEEERLAFYINAYNIILIDRVADLPPTTSPLEEHGLFSEIKTKVAGRMMTLNELEEAIFGIRKDIRLYAALSSATVGTCPVENEAYRPASMDKKLTHKLGEMMKSDNYIMVRDKASLLVLNESFRNMEKYFSREEIINLVNEYVEVDVPLNFTVGFFPSNRRMNSITPNLQN